MQSAISTAPSADPPPAGASRTTKNSYVKAATAIAAMCAAGALRRLVSLRDVRNAPINPSVPAAKIALGAPKVARTLNMKMSATRTVLFERGIWTGNHAARDTKASPSKSCQDNCAGYAMKEAAAKARAVAPEKTIQNQTLMPADS